MINTIDHIINIDLANKINMNQSINIKQNDTNSHKFVINIFNSSVAYDLTGTTSRIYFEKSDATKVFLDCVLDNALTGKLSCLLTTQALSYAGLVASEITIYGTASEILTSVTFNFTVSEVIRDDAAIQSTSEFTALTNALNALDEAVLSIPTVEALNVDLQNNIVTGDALDTTLKADIATGNITDTNIKDSTIIGDATDADLKADIIIAGQNEFATEISNARGGEINLDTRLDKVDTSLADNVTQLALKAPQSALDTTNTEITNARGGEINLETKIDKIDTNIQNNVASLADVAQLYVNVKSLVYNAKGDGISDDTVAIQAAIDANVGKGIVIIPQSSQPYMISSSLVIPLNSHIIIQGTIKLLTDANCHMILVDGANGPKSNIIIEGTGTLDGNRTNQSLTSFAGIEIQPNFCNNIIIRDLTITNIKNWPVNILSAYDVLVENCTFSYSGSSAEFASRCYDCSFVNCTAHHIDDYGLALYGGIYNSSVINCISYDNGASGIEVLSDVAQVDLNHDITIIGNTCYNNASAGIGVEQIGLADGNRNYGIVISDNIVHHNGTSNSGVGGVRIDYSNYVSLTNNISHHNGNGTAGAFGIRIYTSDYCKVFGNTVYNEGQSSTAGLGIQIDTISNFLTIENNTIVDDQSTRTMASMINGASGNNVVIKNNYLGTSIGLKIILSSIGSNNDIVSNGSNLDHSLDDNNALINGNFDIAQRGTTFNNPNNVYTLDRWKSASSVDTNVKIMQSPTVPDSKSKYSLRAEVMTASSGAGAATDISQPIEDFSFLAGQIVTFSCMVKCDAGVSVYSRIVENTDFINSGTISNTIWTPIVLTKTISATITGLGVVLSFSRSGLAIGTGINMAQAKLSVGATALPFSPKSVAQELQDCQRYFQQRSVGAIANIDLRPSMRITPTITGSVSPFNYDAEM